MSDLVWINVEAYFDVMSNNGKLISGKYNQGNLAGESYDAVLTFSGGFWISKYTTYRFRQSIAERFVKRNEAAIIKTAKELMKSNNKLQDPQGGTYEIGKLRRVGIENTGIMSNRSPSGIKYYPASQRPMIFLQFEGTFLAAPVRYFEVLDKRPRAEVL